MLYSDCHIKPILCCMQIYRNLKVCIHESPAHIIIKFHFDKVACYFKFFAWYSLALELAAKKLYFYSVFFFKFTSNGICWPKC